MRISIKRLVATSLLAVLTLAAVEPPRHAATVGQDVGFATSPGAVAATGPAQTSQLVGTGIAAKLACMACAGSFLVATGTGSIAALIVVVGLNPELATGCVVGCIAAFS